MLPRKQPEGGQCWIQAFILLVPQASNRPKGGAHGHRTAQILFSGCLFPPGLPVGVGTSKRQPSGLHLKHLKSYPFLWGPKKPMCGRTQDPKGFIMALASKNELRLLHIFFPQLHTHQAHLFYHLQASLTRERLPLLHARLLGRLQYPLRGTSNFPLFALRI